MTVLRMAVLRMTVLRVTVFGMTMPVGLVGDVPESCTKLCHGSPAFGASVGVRVRPDVLAPVGLRRKCW
jgi:hypothetical protein